MSQKPELEKMLGIESLSEEVAEKDSGLAYVTYTESIQQSDTNVKGEIINFTRPSYEGQVELMSSTMLDKLKEDFPNRVVGEKIKYGNLENVLTMLYNQLKEDYNSLTETNEYIGEKIFFLDRLYRNGKLTADHQTENSLRDLANKVLLLQEEIRDFQQIEKSKNNNDGIKM